MLQEFQSTVHDKQSESELIRTRRFEAVKGLKDIFQLLRCHAHPGIVNLDANARTVVTASQKNLPALSLNFTALRTRLLIMLPSRTGSLATTVLRSQTHSQLNAFLGRKFRQTSN